MLMMENFHDTVKKKLQESKTGQVCVPGGMTALLQPLEVGVNWPFKTHIK